MSDQAYTVATMQDGEIGESLMTFRDADGNTLRLDLAYPHDVGFTDIPEAAILSRHRDGQIIWQRGDAPYQFKSDGSPNP